MSIGWLIVGVVSIIVGTLLVVFRHRVIDWQVGPDRQFGGEPVDDADELPLLWGKAILPGVVLIVWGIAVMYSNL